MLVWDLLKDNICNSSYVVHIDKVGLQRFTILSFSMTNLRSGNVKNVSIPLFASSFCVLNHIVMKELLLNEMFFSEILILIVLEDNTRALVTMGRYQSTPWPPDHSLSYDDKYHISLDDSWSCSSLLIYLFWNFKCSW